MLNFAGVLVKPTWKAVAERYAVFFFFFLKENVLLERGHLCSEKYTYRAIIGPLASKATLSKLYLDTCFFMLEGMRTVIS